MSKISFIDEKKLLDWNESYNNFFKSYIFCKTRIKTIGDLGAEVAREH